MKRTMQALSASAIALSVGIAAGTMAVPKANAVDITNNIGLDFIFETTYGVWKDDAVANTTNPARSDIDADGEVHFDGKFKTDGGLTIGAEVEIETAQGGTGNTDELYAYLSGSFGRIEAGDQDGAADKLAWEVPNVGFGQVDGDYTDFAGPTATTEITDTSDDTKITYYTPSFNGIKAGISYAPIDDSGNNIVTTQGQEEDQVELGLSFGQKMNDVDIDLGLAYFSDNQEAGSQDFGAWSAGVNISFDSFTVGIGHADNGDGGAAQGADTSGTSAGVTYEMGPWGFGVSYAQNEADAASAQDAQIIGAGFNYKFKPKVNGNTPVTMNFAGDFVQFERDASTDGSAVSTDGHVAILFTKVQF